MTTWILKPRVDGPSPELDSVDGSVITVAGFASCADPRQIPTASADHRGSLGDWFTIDREDSLRDQIRIVGQCPWLDRVGGAAPGASTGMDGGRVVVEGSVGSLVGHRMRRGEVFVDGNVGDYPGARMVAGTIVVTGALGHSPMASARRGTLVHSQNTAWDSRRFSRPVSAEFPYASLIRLEPRDQSLQTLLDRCGSGQISVRRGDLSVGGQAEVITVDS